MLRSKGIIDSTGQVDVCVYACVSVCGFGCVSVAVGVGVVYIIMCV